VKETWKPIAGFEGLYEVSSKGSVKSLARISKITPKRRKSYFKTYKEYIMKPTINKDGYLQTALYVGGKSHTKVIHRLVAEAFIPNPKNKPFVNHLDGNKENNETGNLEWCTHLENMQHASKTGLRPRGETHPSTSLTETQVLEIDGLLDSRELTCFEIAKLYNVKTKTIQAISCGESWNWLTNRIEKGKVSDLKGDKNPSARAVVNCRGLVFKTIKEASQAYNISWTGISRVVRGLGLTAGSYEDGTRIKWRYLNNPNKKVDISN
jgi:hypothetical protein